MKTLISMLLVGLLAGSRFSGQAKPDQQKWVEILKATPVARIESGLADKPFHEWLTGLIHPAVPTYTVGDCPAEGASPAGKCVTVTFDVPTVRRAELVFSVPAEQGKPWIFVRGMVGPSDPRSKQPTRLVRKLSELESTSQ